ncbi:MAG: 4-hydroxy-tetrahydrodipicolinate synthase [Firmicutes bacterium]|nr:4-hydroxy-tetrahydrodipicolinate synthase [Bacillota bacterium]
MFSGSFVALVTPFKNNRIDVEKLKELVEFHIKKGTSGIVPCGTTGESPTLSHEEHRLVIETVIKAVNGRIKVIAGTGSNNTNEAIELTRFAKKVGADGCLVITPYYNKPTQNGLYLHFKKIAETVDIPIIMYNVPGRTGTNMISSTAAKLSKIKNIIGLKEASGNITQISQIVRECVEEFDVLSGDDAMTFPILAVGGKGVISVAANIVPAEVAGLVESFTRGDINKSRKMHLKMFPLFGAMFYETNPIPVKTSMNLMGMISDEIRLPLCKMSEENLKKLKTTLKEYKLI